MSELLGYFNPKLDAYEVILGKQKYLAGDSVTLADLTHRRTILRSVKLASQMHLTAGRMFPDKRRVDTQVVE